LNLVVQEHKNMQICLY